MNRRRHGRRLRRRIPSRQQRRKFRRRHHRQIVHRLFWIRNCAQQHRLVVAQPARDRRFIEQVCVVVTVDLQTLIRFNNIEEQIEVHSALRIRVNFRVQSCELGASADSLQVELHFHQWQAARVAWNA